MTFENVIIIFSEKIKIKKDALCCDEHLQIYKVLILTQNETRSNMIQKVKNKLDEEILLGLTKICPILG